MKAPLSGKQQREDLKFLFDELRKTVAQRKEQRRKDQSHQQKMKQSDEKHIQKMDVPPIMGKPMNPEAGPSDKIPALLTAGEAVIPKKAAQNPANKPLIKAMVKEGRSDVNMSVPKPKGFMYGTEQVRGYAEGTEEVLDQYGNPVGTQYEQPQEVPAPVAQDFVTTYDPNAVAPVYEVPAPVAAVPTQVAPTDYNAFTARAESGSNPNIGYHYADGKTSAYGTYGITAGTYKDIQKADPYFKDKPITELSVEEQTKANNVLVGLNTTRLAKNDIEPTPANLRLSHFLGAEGAAEYLKSGKISDEAIKANGGTYEKAKAIADARLAGPASQNRSMAEKAIGVLTGSNLANAADTNATNQGVLEGTKFNKAIGGDTVSNIKEMIGKVLPQGNDLSRIKAIGQAAPEAKLTAAPVPKVEPVATAPTQVVAPPPVVEYKPPQGAYAQQDRYMGDIPKVGGTQQQQIIRNQNSAFNEPEKVQGSIEKYGDSIASTVGSVWDTIKDPKELGNFVTSFVKDTLGFNGQDAARFGLLVAGSRALGYNPTQAIRYAGNYTLVSSDKRAAAKALGETQMDVAMANKNAARDTALIAKGAVRNAKGELVSPGFRPTSETKQMTFDSGERAGLPVNFIKYKEPLSGEERWIDSVSGQEMTQMQKASGNRAFVPFTRDAGTSGQADSFRQWGEGIGKTSGNILDDELGSPRSKKDDKANPMRSGMPTGSEIGSQAASKFREWGYTPDRPEQQNEMNNIISQATRDMVNEKRANPGATIKSIDSYIDKQVIMAKTGMDNTLFLTPANKLTPANRLIEQKNELTNVLRKSNADAPETKINDLVINQYKQFQNEWQGSETVRNLYNKQATDNLSGFYLFAQDRIKENSKKK